MILILVRWYVAYPMSYRCKRPVGTSWRMDETYIKVKGNWVYLYRAIDKKYSNMTIFEQFYGLAA